MNLSCSQSGNLSVVGSQISVSGTTIINSGNFAAGPSFLGYYLSTDSNITTSDYLIGSQSVNGLAAGESATYNNTFNIGSLNIPDGTYYLGLFIDRQLSVTETDEDDNNDCYWTTPQVVINNSVPACQQNDYNTLATFYTQTTGNGWTNRTNWNTASPVNSTGLWHGVTTNASSCVRELLLPNNNLKNDIPTVTGNLSQLEKLSLADNDMTGTLPASLSNLTNLKVATIGQNEFTGTIPKALLELPNLTDFNIDFCNIDSLPPFNNPDLRLWVNNNRLTFDDVLPAIASQTVPFVYGNQDSIYTETTINLTDGGMLTIDLGVDDTVSSNVYTWYKGINIISVINGNNTFSIPSVDVTDSGEYWCRISNPLAPDLVLVSRKTTVVVASGCPTFTANLTGTATICPNGSTNLSFSFTDGVAPYTVSWTNGQLSNVANGQTVSVAPTSTTTYSISSAQDANGCPATVGTSATVSVMDNTPPLASCKTGLSLSLDASQSASLTASTVNEASSDNCNGPLQFSFSSNPSDDNRTFDCSDLGNNLVELWVTDGDGNSNSCQTTIAIQDNQGFCTTNYPVFTANNLIASSGSNVCLDVTVSDFSNILSLQYSMSWDESVLNFTGVQPFGLSGLTASNFGGNVGNGILSVVWTDPNLSGVTLLDNTLIYQVCFDVIGSNGQASPFNFDESVVAIEVTNPAQTLQPVFNSGSVAVVNGTPCTHPDKPALIALYEATGGDNWTSTNRWDTTTCNICDWFGISCDANDRVIGIDLDGVDDDLPTQTSGGGNGLVGYLPNLDMPFLEMLSLSDNDFSGGPFPQLTTPNLTSLTVGHCQMSGPLPPFDFPNLEYLGLCCNNFSGPIPSIIAPNLLGLYLQDNDLSGNLPIALANLDNLIAINMADNLLEGCFPGGYTDFCTLSQNFFSGNIDLPGGGDFDAFCADGTGACITTTNCPLAGTTSIAVTNTNDSGPGSLRQAILCVNADPVLDTIKFDIPGNASWTIQLASDLPVVSGNNIVIDGTTQPNWTPGSIFIQGNMSMNYGLPLAGDGCEIYGLRIENVPTGISILSGNGCSIGTTGKPNLILNCNVGIDLNVDGNTVTGNLLGTNSDETVFGGFTGYGITIGTSNNHIENNTIVGAFQSAIFIGGNDNNLISRNRLYCNATNEPSTGLAINNGIPSNLGIQPPAIASVNLTTLNGTSAPNDIIEVFISDNASPCGTAPCQGKTYLGTTLADAAGNWTLSAPFAAPLNDGDQVTATATAQSNTSEFSACTTVQTDTPNNDNCNGVISLGIAPVCPSAIFSNTNATESNIGADNFPDCFVAPYQDVWFSFTATTNFVDYRISVTGFGGSSVTEPQIAVYRGDCVLDGLQLLGCSAATVVGNEAWIDLDSLTPGVVYFIRVNSSAANWGSFQFCIQENPCVASNFGISAIATAVSCTGSTDGTVTINANNGTAPFLFSLNGSPLQSVNSFGNLPPGVYSCAVRDNIHCIDTLTNLVVGEPSPLSLNTITTTPACSGSSSGAIQLAAVGGTSALGNYSFSWPNASPQTGPSANFSGLDPGSYTCTVSDDNGCTQSSSVSILELPAAQDSLSTTLCPGESLTIGNATFSQANPAGPAVLVNAASNGCDSTINVSLSFYLVSPVNLGNDYAFCNTTTLNAGLGSAYAWSTNATTPNIEVTQAGIYSVTVTDGNGCTSSDAITLQSLPTLQTNITPFICEGESYQVGNSTYTQPGNYVDTLTSVGFCDSVVFTNLTVIQPIVLNVDSTLCPGDSLVINGETYNAANPFGTEILGAQNSSECDTTVNINLSFYPPAQSDFKPTLCPGESVVINGTEYDEANPTGTEVLLNASINGCDSTVNIALSFLAALETNLDTVICAGDTLFFNGQVLDTSGEYVQVTPSFGGCDSLITTMHLTVLDPSPPLALDDEATVAADELSVDITVTDNDELPNEPGDDWQLTPISMPALGSLSQNGSSFVFTLDDPDSYGQDSFAYTVCHAVCTQLCDMANVLLLIEQDCIEDSEDERVNVFTPNGDGVNDEFDPLEPYRLAGCAPTGATGELTIHNRWGEAVFRAVPYRIWDGTNDGGEKLPQGAYYYHLKVGTREKAITVKGVVNLITENGK